MKYLVSGSLVYYGDIEIEADSAAGAVELFNKMTPDELDRWGMLNGNDCDIDIVRVLQDDCRWVDTDEPY